MCSRKKCTQKSRNIGFGKPSGSIPCAEHRPPHRKGRRTVMVNEAWMPLHKKKSLGNKAQGAAKTIVKQDPETLQNAARRVPRPSKIEAREVPGSQNPPKRRPRPAKRRFRGAQAAPKRAQEPPKGVQKLIKWRPRVAQEGPRPLQNQARRARRPVFSVIFAASSVRPGLEANFASFSRCALDGRYAFRISFIGALRA